MGSSVKHEVLQATVQSPKYGEVTYTVGPWAPTPGLSKCVDGKVTLYLKTLITHLHASIQTVEYGVVPEYFWTLAYKDGRVIVTGNSPEKYKCRYQVFQAVGQLLKKPVK